MIVDYKKLWILLIQKGISKPQLREMTSISASTMTKLNKNEVVSLDVIVRICRALDVDVGAIVEVAK